jgi:hypothetical protein
MLRAVVSLVLLAVSVCACSTSEVTPRAPAASRASIDAPVAEAEAEPSPPDFLDVVTSQADAGPTENIVREALLRELASMQWDEAEVRGHYTVSAKVTKLTSAKEPGKAVASCTVATLLQHDQRGMVALLQGSALAEDAPDAVTRAEERAIDAAARGSIRGLRAAILDVE